MISAFSERKFDKILVDNILTFGKIDPTQILFLVEYETVPTVSLDCFECVDLLFALIDVSEVDFQSIESIVAKFTQISVSVDKVYEYFVIEVNTSWID